MFLGGEDTCILKNKTLLCIMNTFFRDFFYFYYFWCKIYGPIFSTFTIFGAKYMVRFVNLFILSELKLFYRQNPNMHMYIGK